MIYRIRDWNDMRQFGFDALTGESCRLGTRLLFDISPQAQKVLLDFWGLSHDAQEKTGTGKHAAFRESWNSHRDSDGNYTDSWGSVMLSRDILFPLAAQALWHVGCTHILQEASDTSAEGTAHYFQRDELREMAFANYQYHWRDSELTGEVDCDHWLQYACQAEIRWPYGTGFYPGVCGLRADTEQDQEDWDRHVSWMKAAHKVRRVYRHDKVTLAPGSGTRNQHQFSGRTE